VEQHYGILVHAPAPGRLVQIVALQRRVDAGLVARDIDLDPLLNAPDAAGFHCYVACDLHHMSRFLHPSEAACERWGSLMHQLFDDEQNMPPWRTADRLFLRESGLHFLGSPADEDFISLIVEILEAGEGRVKRSCAWTKDALRALRLGAPAPVSTTIQQLLKEETAPANPLHSWDPLGTRTHWNVPRKECALAAGCSSAYNGWMSPEYRKRYAPAALPTAVSAKIRRVVHGEPGSASSVPPQLTIDALPRVPGEETVVGSSLRGKIAGWFASEAGKEWVRRRAELFAEPNAPDDMEARVEEDRV